MDKEALIDRLITIVWQYGRFDNITFVDLLEIKEIKELSEALAEEPAKPAGECDNPAL